MSYFENLLERIENKFPFGGSKQSAFVTQVKELFKGEEADPNVIWQGLNGPDGEENAAFYCLQLFNSLNHLDKKSHLAPYEEKMFATLLALEFYKNKTPKSTELIQNNLKFAENKELGHSKWVIKYFLRTNENLNFAEFYCSRLVFAPGKFDWEKNITEQIMLEVRESLEYSRRLKENKENQDNEFTRIKRISYQQPNETEPRSLAYSYACFIDYVKKNNFIITREEFKHMEELLSAYMHAISSESLLFEFLSVIIHLIKNCIKFYGCPYEDILKEMVIWANQIRLMPGKINIMGEKFFNILVKELKVRGSTFRKKVLEDFPYLENKNVQFTSREFYFVTGSEDFVSENNPICLLDLRKSLIIHILKVSEIHIDQIDEIADILDNLDENEVFSFFQKAMKVVEVMENLECYEKIKEIQKQSIEKLIKMFKEKVGTKKKSFEIEFENKSNSGSEFVHKRSKKWGAYESIREHPLGIFEYPEYKISHIALKEFLDSKSPLSFGSIIKKHKETYPSESYYFSPNKVPIVFYGNRDEFFRFIRPFGEYLEKIDISNRVNFKIYYLSKPNPASRPSIASYIGYNDILYRKIAMNAFKEKLLFPYLEPNSQNRDTFPVVMMNKCLHSYLREARHVLPLHLHKCIVRRLGIKNNVLEEPVFFSEAVTFGVFAEAEMIKMDKFVGKNGKSEKSKELIEIMSSKLKKFTPYTLSMEIEYLETISDEFITNKEEFIKVDDIQICNSPREYFLGKKPIPSNSILEMTILPTSNSKLFRKEISNPDNFKKKRQVSDILLAFQDLLVAKSVRRVKIENLEKDKPLKILIDGVEFEGVDSFIIEPSLTLEGTPISIPLQTFLPIS